MVVTSSASEKSFHCFLQSVRCTFSSFNYKNVPQVILIRRPEHEETLRDVLNDTLSSLN